MMKMLKKVFCRHRAKKPIKNTIYVEKASVITHFGKQCKRCGRKWWD